MLNLASLAAPSPPDNFILITQILSAPVWISFLPLQLCVIWRAFLTRYQQPTSLQVPDQLSVATARRGNCPVPPCTNSWAVVDGINCWYALGCVFLLLSFPLQLWKARFWGFGNSADLLSGSNVRVLKYMCRLGFAYKVKPLLSCNKQHCRHQYSNSRCILQN